MKKHYVCGCVVDGASVTLCDMHRKNGFLFLDGQPDSPEKKCCEKCDRRLGTYTSETYCSQQYNCPCHKPEDKKCLWCGKSYFEHENTRPDNLPVPKTPCLLLKSGFVVRKEPEIPQKEDEVNIYRGDYHEPLIFSSDEPSFVDRKIEEFRDTFRLRRDGHSQGLEQFLRAALKEAMLQDKPWDNGFKIGQAEGRLAMKEEIVKIIEKYRLTMIGYPDAELGSHVTRNDILATIQSKE